MKSFIPVLALVIGVLLTPGCRQAQVATTPQEALGGRTPVEAVLSAAAEIGKAIAEAHTSGNPGPAVTTAAEKAQSIWEAISLILAGGGTAAAAGTAIVAQAARSKRKTLIEVPEAKLAAAAAAPTAPKAS